MNRKLPRFLAVPLVFPLIFSLFFCCCLTQTVHAEYADRQINQAQHAYARSNHCDSHDSAEHHSAPQHNCECPKLLSILSGNFDIFQTADIVLYSFNRQIVLGEIFLSFVPDSHKLLTEHSQPFSSSVTPLYIKNPSLRI